LAETGADENRVTAARHQPDPATVRDAVSIHIGSALFGAMTTAALLLLAATAWRIVVGSHAVVWALPALALSVLIVWMVSRTRRQRLERRRLTAELVRARATSDAARDRAETASRAKSRFLAAMSHELRTPLNAILGFSDVIKSEIFGPLGNETYKDYVADIHRAGEHLLKLINDILDLSRIEAGRHELHEEPLHLCEIAETCIGMTRPQAWDKRITVETRFERALPPVWADGRSLRQVVLNLLSNAMKFTPPGGEVLVKAGWTAGGGQYVAVADNGPGIPDEEMPHVFTAFDRGTGATKRAEEGTGLGLPIAKAILGIHGGRLTLTSRQGNGTEAIAVLPSDRILIDTPGIEMPDPETNGHRSQSDPLGPRPYPW